MRSRLRLPRQARRHPEVKVLWFDGQGLMLLAKRLDQGRFVWPQETSGSVLLTPAQLSMLLEGIDWRMPVHTYDARCPMPSSGHRISARASTPESCTGGSKALGWTRPPSSRARWEHDATNDRDRPVAGVRLWRPSGWLLRTTEMMGIPDAGMAKWKARLSAAAPSVVFAS
ncbi:IS66 family insertion sequence element accessory protein TnpB [Variovorax sp. LjRoot84]|uniref:IS66 family insertion sequence element accessory protein TnpB n=1 Tax=Variovorax sp. LjRoot84 TaxID=3342340 RepID=UPI003F51819F